MNFKNLFYLGVVALFLIACSEEPANMECDVENIWVHVDNPRSIFYPAQIDNGDTLIIVSTSEEGKFITWTVKTVCDPGAYPVYFTTTPGAKSFIYDENGSKRAFSSGEVVDFSNEKKTTIEIISEDGAWNKQYELSMVHRPASATSFSFDFNEGSYVMHSPMKGSPGTYYMFKPTDPKAIESLFYNPDDPYWKNGNPGFALSRSAARSDEYPTTMAFGAGPDGSDCLLMHTVSTGGIGAMARIYIASGSLFTGAFDAQKAMKSRSAARLATRFGVPFDHKPVSMTLDMKYVPGPNYWDEDKNVIPGIVDEPDAYVVFYRNNVDGGMLDGYDVLTNENIIAIARVKHRFNADGSDMECGDPIHGITTEWQRFTLDLEYTREPDPDILENMGYSIIIGFSSSWQGADFRGALDSSFYIDNIFIDCE